MTMIAPADSLAPAPPARRAPQELRIALCGLGQVGSALARLMLERPARLDRPMRLSAALVRSLDRRSPAADIPLTTDIRTVFDSRPDVVVEALGGIEPARTILLEALNRRIPVVTANKSLLAAHGEELLAAAARTGTPLKYEATVIAGVPFLGALEHRPWASAVTRVTGILNGTSHFILTSVEAGASFDAALHDAQSRGLAEPNPASDISGRDAAEKLTILARHFCRRRLPTSQIPTTGIDGISAGDMIDARGLGGTIKPIAFGDWSREDVYAFVGPAFLPFDHALAGLRGVTNGICLQRGHRDPLVYSGPGAGPEVTAETLLDDVLELVERRERRSAEESSARPALPMLPETTGWFVRLQSASALPRGADVADLLASYGVSLRQTSRASHRGGRHTRAFLTCACTPAQIAGAIRALTAAATCDASYIPALDDHDAH